MLRIILRHQVDAVQRLPPERIPHQAETEIGTECRTVHRVVLALIIEIRRMHTEIPHFGKGDMLGHGKEVTVPIAIAGIANSCTTILPRRRTHIIRPNHNLRRPRLPPTLLP